MTCYTVNLPIVFNGAPLKGLTPLARGARELSSPGRNSPVHAGGAIPACAPTYQIFPGAGVIMQPGVPEYGVTANTGKGYRLVWSGSTLVQHFYGSVWTTGTFTADIPGCSDHSCPVPPGGTISQPINETGGQRIDFDTIPGLGLVGLDFVVTAEPVYFDLFVDGVHTPGNVFFPVPPSGQTATAGAVPFALTTHWEQA